MYVLKIRKKYILKYKKLSKKNETESICFSQYKINLVISIHI